MVWTLVLVNPVKGRKHQRHLFTLTPVHRENPAPQQCYRYSSNVSSPLYLVRVKQRSLSMCYNTVYNENLRYCIFTLNIGLVLLVLVWWLNCSLFKRL